MPTEDPLLESRTDGDPAAEALLGEAVKQSGRTATEILRGLRKPATETPSWLHVLLDRWTQQDPELPSWIDSELMIASQRFFDDYDLAICTALFTASLPSAYAGAKGVGVLARVSQLAEQGTVNRRIAETGQMLLDITQPGALERGGVGYRRVVRVRMLHAAVRVVLLGNDAPGGSWPSADGVPVNQQDLLATLTTFTVIVFRALDRMGVQVSLAEQEAYLHLWAVVGELLGITEAKRMRKPQDAQSLTTNLQESLQAPSADGAFLMSALLDEMEFSMPLGWLRIPRTFVRFLIGDRVADMLAVPAAAWWSPALEVAAALNRRVNRYPFVRRIGVFPARLVGRRMIEFWIDEHQRGERGPVSITARQRRRWRIAADNLTRPTMRKRLQGPSAAAPKEARPRPARCQFLPISAGSSHDLPRPTRILWPQPARQAEPAGTPRRMRAFAPAALRGVVERRHRASTYG